jgi:hypothetical protein
MELDLSENADFLDEFGFDLVGIASFFVSIVSSFRSREISLLFALSSAIGKSALP